MSAQQSYLLLRNSAPSTACNSTADSYEISRGQYTQSLPPLTAYPMYRRCESDAHCVA